MQYFKKFPIFFSLMIVLLAAFVGGIAYDAYSYTNLVKQQKKLRNARADYDDALAADPTQATIDKASANIKTLENHLNSLEKSLTRARDDIFSPAPAESYQLVERLRGLVQTWKRTAAQKNIAVKSGMDFGFKRYVAPNAEPPRQAAVSPLWKQACVLNYITKKLFECKTEQSPMAIVNVQREVLDSENEAKKATTQRRMTLSERRAAARMAMMRGSGDNSETFTVDQNITARKPGSLDTLAYRFTFAGHTDILRRFLNLLKNFDAMLVVRSIDVVPADQSVDQILNSKPEDEETAGLEAIFGATETADDQQATQEGEGDQAKSETSGDGAADLAAQEQLEKIKTPVVTGNLSKFSVVIEYVEVVKEPPEKAAKKAKEEE